MVSSVDCICGINYCNIEIPFSYEQSFMADLVRYWYAAMFLFASAYTLYEEGHVRVDVIYAGLSDKVKAYVNAWGSYLLGVVTMIVVVLIGFNGKTSIINSPCWFLR